MFGKGILVSSLSLILLSGCASMSKSECANANWETQGSLDGRSGYPLTRLARHAKACARISVLPDEALYRRGYANGVQLYCTPTNGLKQGRKNARYHDVCPVDLEAPFLNSFVDGLELKLSDVEQRKSAAESRLFRLRVEQAALKGPVPEKLAKKLDRQETAITNLENEKYQLRLRISELRLQVTSLAR